MSCYCTSLLTADNCQVISAINKAVLFSLSALSYLVPEQKAVKDMFTLKHTTTLH